MRGGPAYVGLDLGTSGLKGVVLDEAGSVVAEAARQYVTHHPAAGAAEQDPAEWLDRLGTVLGELGQHSDKGSWVGMGLTGMIPTLVTLDVVGVPNGPAITWEDARADSQGARLRAKVGEEALYRITGQWLDGRYLLPMFSRLSEEGELRSGKTATICSAKDYLFFFLTGELATDPSTASGFGCYDLAASSWHRGVLDVARHLLPGELPVLPSLPALQPASMVRPLSSGAAWTLGLPPGLPVTLGAADSVLGATGLGVVGDGEVAYIAGTSSVILALSSRLVLDRAHRYLVTPMTEDGRWGLEMDLLATGSALAWLAQILGAASVALIGELARTVEPAKAPVFLPYLGGGEQGALWDPTLRGTLIGLDLHHDKAHIARAMLNGILMESRRCLEVLEEARRERSVVHFSGPGAIARGFGQDLADATGRRVVVSPALTMGSSVVGAAMWAARAVGGAAVEQSMREARQAAATVVEPVAAQKRAWDRLYARHTLAYAALRPLYHAEGFGEESRS